MSSIEYSLSNSKLYPDTLMQRRSYKLFITIPHTDLSVSEAISPFISYKQTVYCKVAQEHHEDGDTHIHIFISFKNQVKYSVIHNMLHNVLQGKRIKGAVNYQVPKNSEAVCQYIDKEGNTEEFGERPKRVGKEEGGRPHGSNQEGALEAIQLAQNGNVAEALEILKENQPMRILENLETIQENLKRLNQTRIKYDIPVYTQDNTTFKKWQQELLDIISGPPKKRRIIWVVGQPESGKTFIHDYLANIENYRYGMYDAGQSVSYDNVVYGYDEEGIVSWDFPMNYDWGTFETQAGNLIEKFSDFGTQVSSKKYKGSSKYIRGHCLVFSNREPLENLKHRDVLVIRASKENKSLNNDKIDKIDKISPGNFEKQETRTDKCMLDRADKIDKIFENTNSQVDENDGIVDELYIPGGMSRMEYICQDIDNLTIRLKFLRNNNLSEEEENKVVRRIEQLQEIIHAKCFVGKAHIGDGQDPPCSGRTREQSESRPCIAKQEKAFCKN